ncbi:hypothetical protein [Halioxenophilus sp. WMMB6]|uniref:hypothetical protein n=1 Tax=Halioxenophilus sp. WMMB6 TaxID=3073815 RepID=UPI00295F461B|nr:hypothetical protein [Halioxenophilus sp. WMMB6]
MIYSVVTGTGCGELLDYWQGFAMAADSPFAMVAAIFALLFGWSLVDVIRALLFNYRDKTLVVVVFLVMTVCTLFIGGALKAQWELMQIVSGTLTPSETLLLNVEGERFATDTPSIAPPTTERCKKYSSLP